MKNLSPYLFLICLGWLLVGCTLLPEQSPSTEVPPVLPETLEPLVAQDGTASVTIAPSTPRNQAAPTLQPTLSVHIPLVASGEATDTPVAKANLQVSPSPAAQVTSPTTEPQPTSTPNYPVHEGPPLNRRDFGVQIHLHREDLGLILSHLRSLGVGWVKVQVSWKIYEPEPGRFDDYRFGELDRLVAAANDNDIEVLLGVAKAPEWSRPTAELDGPPQDYARFQSFMQSLATRYRGQVAAYELWNEPNLNREWNGAPLNAQALVQLISAGAAGVRAADPEALLISAPPATTGINDGQTAIDDRLYLQQMLAAGVTNFVDAVGAHPYGWANPPDSSVTDPDPVAPSHNNHPSFFFADTLADYRRLLDQAGAADIPIWVTEFGWGSYDGFNVGPPPGVEYMAAVNEQQQAAYILRAYEMASEWDWVGPLFLWNLNFAPTFGDQFVESAYSLLRPDGSTRPAYHALSTISNPDASGR